MRVMPLARRQVTGAVLSRMKNVSHHIIPVKRIFSVQTERLCQLGRKINESALYVNMYTYRNPCCYYCSLNFETRFLIDRANMY